VAGVSRWGSPRAQGSADFDQTLCHGIVHDRDIRPDRTNQLTLAHYPAVVLHEVNQNLEWLGAQLYLFPATAQKAVVEIQREAAKRVPTAGPFSGMWLNCAQPELLEGLDGFLTKLSCRHHDFKGSISLSFC
jgi:hypothetical protein